MTEKIGTGKVYKITSSQTDKIYIGSTFEKYLSNRLSGHRTNYKQYIQGKCGYITSFKLLEYDDCEIELIKKYDNITKQELQAKEGKYIKKNADVVVNKCVAGRTRKQYREDNVESIRELKKKYQQENKDKIKKYREDNKNKIKIRHKEYREENIDKIKIRQKEYREENIDKCKEYNKQYREENIDKIKEYKNEKNNCQCGGNYNSSGKARHLRTKKHIDYVNSN